MSPIEKSSVEAVAKILKDLNNRSGLRGMWESIDEETQQEIFAVWVGIVRNVFNSHSSTG